ncbi:MAG: DUF748 domain-containing protein [Planctomycetota bacterium]
MKNVEPEPDESFSVDTASGAALPVGALPSDEVLSEAVSPKQRSPRRRRWARRLGWFVALLVVGRIGLGFAIQPIARTVAAGFGVDLSWERMDIALHSGRVEIWRLRAGVAAEEEGASPAELAEISTVALDVDVSALFTGRLRVRRLEVDGVRAQLVRGADGTWRHAPILERLGGGESPPPEASKKRKEPGPIALRSPVEVVAARIQDVEVSVLDEAVGVESLVQMRANVVVADIGAEDRRGRVRVLVTSPQMLDLLSLGVDVDLGGDRAELEMTTKVAGLRPGPLAPFLEPLGIEPVARTVGGRSSISSSVEHANDVGDRLRASIAVRDVSFLHDGRECVGLDGLGLVAREIWSGGLLLDSITVEGPRMAAERLTDGGLSFSGFAYRGAPKTAGPPAQREEEIAAAEAPEPAPEADDPPAADTQPFRWGVDEIRVTAGRLALTDFVYDPPKEAVGHLDELRIGSLSSVPDARPDAGSEVLVEARVPGYVETLRVEGAIRDLTPLPDLGLRLSALGIDPVEARPYLALIGLEPIFEDGSLVVDEVRLGEIEGPSEGLSVAVRGVRLEDAGAELGALGAIEVDVPSDAPVAVRVSGVTATATRTVDDAIEALGLRIGGSPTGSPAGSPRADAPSTERDAPDPAVEPREVAAAGSFEVPPLWLPLVDATVDRLVLIDASDEATPFSVGPARASIAPLPADGGDAGYRLEFTGATRSARDLTAAFDVRRSAEGRIGVTGQASAKGCNFEHVEPWFALVGLEPLFVDADLEVGLEASLESADGRPRIDLAAGPVRVVDRHDGGTTEWLSVERLEAEGVTFGDALEVDAIRVRAPEAYVHVGADGSLEALGLRVLPPEDPGAGTAGEVAATETSGAPEAGSTAPSAAPSTAPPTGSAAAPASTPSVPEVRIGRIELDAGKLALDDGSFDAPHVVVVGADAKVEQLALGAGVGPTSIDGELRVGDTAFRATGSAVLDPQDLRVELGLGGERMSGEAVGPYLPPHIAIVLDDGVFAANVRARLAREPEGGTTVDLTVEGVDLRERGAEEPLLALEGLRLDVPRLDPEATHYNIEEVSVAGLRISVLRTRGGGLSACGVAIEPPAAPEAEADPAAGAEEEPLQVAASGGASGPVRGPGEDLEELPFLRLARVDVELAELEVTSEGFEDDDPLRLSSTLRLREPYELEFDPRDEDLDDEAQPFAFDLVVDSQPGPGRVMLKTEMSPFVSEPRFGARLEITDMQGGGLLRLAPELADRIDPSGVDGGSVTLDVGARLEWRRRSPFDFDLSGGFGAVIALENAAIRATPDSEIALGVDRVVASARRITPRSGSLRLSRLEVETIRAHVDRTDEGFHVAGITVRDLPAPESAPMVEPEPEPEPEAESVEPAAPVEANAGSESPERASAGGTAGSAAPPPASKPRGDLRIDELLARDLDVVYRDLRADPPFVLPLDTFDLDARGLTTAALTEPIPLRFSVLVGAGDVELPVRLKSASLLRGVATGVVSGVGSAVGMKAAEEVEYEQRPLFGEMAASGRLVLAPSPSGWLRGSVSGFELLGMRGLARESGVEIGDGVLDSNVRVRLSGQAGGRVDSVSSFNSLKLSEPDGGPISRFLKLPATLDTVLFVLKNERGELRIPLSFTFGEGGTMSTREIAQKASGAFLGLVTEALASAPMRAVGTVTDVVGLGGILGGGDGTPKRAGMTATLEFSPGGTTLDDAAVAALGPIINALKEDELLVVEGVHLLSPADLERAGVLSSPGAPEARRLLTSLRRQRRELTRARDDLAVVARSQLLLAQTEEYEATRTRLVATDRDLGEVERGIDRVAALLRPGAENQRARRTRQAALAIAGTRLDAVRRAFLDAGLSPSRFSLRPPRYDIVEGEGADTALGRVGLVTKGGTPPKSFIRRAFGWLGL